MSEITSFRDVVELWGPKDASGSRIAMAAEVGGTAGMVAKWWQRNWIPPEWWSSVISTDKARGAGVDAELLTRLAAREACESVRA